MIRIGIMFSRSIGGIKWETERHSSFDEKAPHWRGALDHYGPVPQLTLYSPSDDFFE